MSTPSSADPAGTDLRALPACSKLAEAVGAAARSAMAAGRGQLADPEGAVALEDDEARTPDGDLREILGRGPDTDAERDLLSRFLVLYAAGPDTDRLEGARLLIWATARTDCDALGRVDAVLGPDAGPVWNAIGRVAADSSTVEEPSAPALTGELTWAPRGPAQTALLVLSGIALLRAVIALVARHALGMRRPATVRLTGQRLEISHRVELLGKPVREGQVVLPMSNLASIARDVRFGRAGTYAGLAALVLGTYVGVSVFADGARAPGGSPTLILLGLAIVGLGLGLDFLLTSALDAARRKVRLVVVPQRGPALCVGGLEPDTVDSLLRDVAKRA